MTLRPDPTFHATAKLAMEAPAREIAYTLMLSPDFSQPDGLAVVDVDPASAHLRQGRPHGDHAQQGRRVSPFRLERLLLGAVADDRPRVPGAPLPDHSGHPLVAHLRRSTRRTGRPGAKIHKIIEPEEVFAQDRLFAAAHHPLRAGGHLRLHARRRRQGRHRRAARHLHHGLRDLRRDRPLRDRPRRAGQALRFLVEPAARLHGVERMGAAAAVRERHRRRRTCSPTNTATASISGICARAAMSRPSISGANHQMALEVRPGARSGQGIRFPRRRRRHHQSRRLDLDLVARGRQVPLRRRPRRSRPSRRQGRRCRRCSRASAPCRR